MGSNANHQKMEAASSVQEKDKMAEGSGFVFSLPYVVANLLILDGQGWVISDNNYGSGTKMISLCEVEKN